MISDHSWTARRIIGRSLSPNRATSEMIIPPTAAIPSVSRRMNLSLSSTGQFDPMLTILVGLFGHHRRSVKGEAKRG